MCPFRNSCTANLCCCGYCLQYGVDVFLMRSVGYHDFYFFHFFFGIVFYLMLGIKFPNLSIMIVLGTFSLTTISIVSSPAIVPMISVMSLLSMLYARLLA